MAASGVVEHMRQERAALKVQTRWRCKTGQMAAHLRRRALADEAAEQNAAAAKLQARFRGNKARAALPDRILVYNHKKEMERLNAAALKVQCRWRIKQGKLFVHLKRQAKRERDREEYEAACMLQRSYRSKRARGTRQLLAQIKLARETKATLKIQCWYRGVTGRFSYHLKMQAKKIQDDLEREAACMLQRRWRGKASSQSRSPRGVGGVRTSPRPFRMLVSIGRRPASVGERRGDVGFPTRRA